MIIQPRTLGFICTTAHPDGCARNVQDQIQFTRHQGLREDGPRRVLIIGASTGYGLAARISAAFGFGAATLGVFLEKPGKARRSGSAGWYNSAAFHQETRAAGLTCSSIRGDAFADATRACAIERIREDLGGPVDLVVYSLAAPVRQLPDSDERLHTAIKPIGQAFTGTTIDTDRDELTRVTLEPASAQEIADTTRVMGGEDWALWIHALAEAGVLTTHARTVAFSYLGPELTWPIYRDGTIGHAKQHLEQTAGEISAYLGRPGGARVAVLKSIVTQASAAIPVIPLYLSVVFRIMKDRGLHEGAIEQQNRLFRDHLYGRDPREPDSAGRLRLDDRELAADVQADCKALWSRIDNDNFAALTDYAGYKHDFLNLFGFAREDVDYTVDVDPIRDFDCSSP